MTNNFMTDLLQRVEDVGAAFSSTAYSSLGEQVLLLSRLAMIIYIWHYCLLVMFAQSNINMGELLKRMCRMIFLLMIIGNWSFFDFYIYQTVINVPENIGRLVLQTISGVSSADPTDGLMQIWNTANKVASTIAAQAGYFSILPNIIAFLVWFIILIFAALSLAIIILAKMIVWVLVAVAPVFIGCFLFEVTRPIARGWVSQLLLYALMPLFTYVIIALVIAMILPTLNQLDTETLKGEISLEQVGTFCIASVSGLFILLNVHTITQGIVGAVSVGIGSAARAFLTSTSTAGLAIGAVAARGTGAGISRSVSALRNRNFQNSSRDIEDRENSKPSISRT